MLRTRSCTLLFTATVLLLMSFVGLHHPQSIAARLGYQVNQSPLQKPQLISHESEAEWHFNVMKDARNRGLSEHHCDSAFPDLWQELSRAKNWHSKERQGGYISKSDIDQYGGRAQLRLMIYHGQVCSSLHTS